MPETKHSTPADLWMDEPFVVGDEVKRPANIYAESGLQRRGTVTRAYSTDMDDELYEVVWHTEGGKPLDPPLRSKGYYRWGLRHA